MSSAPLAMRSCLDVDASMHASMSMPRCRCLDVDASMHVDVSMSMPAPFPTGPTVGRPICQRPLAAPEDD